jgi:outer membrane autotransporter protein
MNKHTRSGKAIKTDADGGLRARRRRLVDSIRDVMTIGACATVVTQAQAAEPYSIGPYLQLSKGHDVTTEKGYYESTGQGAMFSAIRMTGPYSKIHIFDSTLVGLYWQTHALFARQGGVADAQGSSFRAEGLEGSAVVSDGSMFKIERSKVETLGNRGHGIFVRGSSATLDFSGGEIVTRKGGANAARAEDGGTLFFRELLDKERDQENEVAQSGQGGGPDTGAAGVSGTATTRRRTLRTRLTTEGGQAAALFLTKEGISEGHAVDLETRGPDSPAVLIERDGRATFWSSTFKVAAGNTPIVSMKDGAVLSLRDLTLDTGVREVPVIVAEGERQLILLTDDAQLAGRTLLSLNSMGQTPGSLTLIITDTAGAVGDVRTDEQSRLKIQLLRGGRFEGRLTGQVDFDAGLDGVVALLETTRMQSMSLGGRVGFARSAPPEQTIVVKALQGEGGAVALRTLLNSGGPLAAQKTDRLLVEGDLINSIMLVVEAEGMGEPTDSNRDNVNQASEGISLVQVAGKSWATSVSLLGSYIARGPYRYELAAFAPGASDKAQRLVSGTGDFWDYRLVSFGPPGPEPVVIEPPPPVPEPEVIEPPPSPVVVEPPPPPVPEPVVIEPPPPPVPEPVVIEPPPPPVPEPVVIEPPPPPVPEPVVIEPPQPPPVPEPVVVEPPPPPVPEPVVVEPPPPPVPEPVVVEPPPPPVPEPVVVEPPPPPVPEPVVVEPPPAPEPVVVVEPPAPVLEVPVVEPAPPAPEPAEPAPSTTTATASPPPVLVPQASAYIAMPLAAAGFLREALHAWGHPHVNPAGSAQRVSGEDARGFAHVLGSRGRYRASGQERAHRPDFSTRQYGAQFGLPVHRYRTANGTTRVDIGASASDAGFAINAPLSQSHSRIKIAGLGLRVAHMHASGAYAAGLLKIDHLGVEVHTRERNQVAAFGGIGMSALCELGAAAFMNGWTIESSIRASYVEVRLRDFVDADRVSVKPQPSRSASAGIGSRVSRTFTTAGLTVRPYIGAGLAYASGPPSSQSIGGVQFSGDTINSSWEASAGFEGRLGKNARLLVDVAVQDGLDHGFGSVFATGAVHWAF